MSFVPLLSIDKECSLDDRTWLTHGTDLLESLPIGVVEQALKGSETTYTVNPDKPKVCFRISGVHVTLTKLQFNVIGVDSVRVSLYKQDGKTPIAGQVGAKYVHFSFVP